jgi:hypothetical protein
MRARNILVLTMIMAVALVPPLGNWGIFGGAEALAHIHYKCYKIVPGGQPVLRTITLEDQFGEQKNVLVTASELLCAPAKKDGDGTFDVPHLKCYVISRDAPPLRQTVLLDDQFGEEEVEVMEPQLLCQEVEKTLPQKTLPK